MGVKYFPALLHDNTHRVVRSTQDAQRTAEVSWDLMITEYAHDEYCDMLLTPGTCSSRTGTAGREYPPRHPGRRHPNDNVFRRFEQRLSETGSVTHANAGCRKPTNENSIITAMKRELSQPRDLEVLQDVQLHPYHYSRSTHLFPHDRPLQVQFCEWLRHQHTADGLFLHSNLRTDEACFILEGALKPTTVTSGHGVILRPSATVVIKSASVSAFRLES
jgi:hypothetical protein